jgi:hypothetical protein
LEHGELAKYYLAQAKWLVYFPSGEVLEKMVRLILDWRFRSSVAAGILEIFRSLRDLLPSLVCVAAKWRR